MIGLDFAFANRQALIHSAGGHLSSLRIAQAESDRAAARVEAKRQRAIKHIQTLRTAKDLLRNAMAEPLQSVRKWGGNNSDAQVITWALGKTAHEYAAALHRVATGQASASDASSMEAAIFN